MGPINVGERKLNEEEREGRRERREEGKRRRRKRGSEQCPSWA